MQKIYARGVFTFSASHFLNDLVTTGIVPALVVMYKAALHLNYTESTLVVLVSYLTSSVVQPFFGMMTDRKPRVWFYSLGVFLSITGLALTGIATTLWELLIFVAISGFGSGIFHPEASRGTHLASGGQKGLAQAIFQVGGNAGQAFGPLMLPLFVLATGVKGLLWFLPVAVLSLLLTTQILPWLSKSVQAAKQKVQHHQENRQNHLVGVILLIFIILFRSWCQIGVVIFLPFYMPHQALQVTETLNFAFVGAGAIGTFFGGLISDFLGMKRLLIVSMFLATPFALLFAHLTGVLAIIDLLLFGFSVLSSFSVGVVYMQKLLPKNIGLASGLSIGFGVGAGGIGSVFMGVVSDHFGVPIVFSILALLPLLAAIIAIFLPNDRKLSIPV